MAGLAAIGVEIPRGRLTREVFREAWGTPPGHGARAVAAGDEDVVTMAVAAGVRALADGAAVDALILATTSSPFADKSSAAIIAAALGLADDIRTVEVCGTTRCGLEALRLAADLVDVGAARAALVIVSERPPTRPGSAEEHLAGDAAVAIVVDRSAALATFAGWGAVVDDLTARWRLATDAVPREFERRLEAQHGFGTAIGAALNRALHNAGLAGTQVTAAVVPGPDGRPVPAAARAAGVPTDRLRVGLVDQTGVAGAAAPILDAVRLLPSLGDGDHLLVAAHGDGAAALVLRRGRAAASDPVAPVLRRSRAVPSYGQYLASRHLIEQGDEDGGLEVSPVSYWRRRRSILRREGARCGSCGIVQFPPAPRCTECGSPQLSPTRLGLAGQIYTFTNDHLVAGSYVDVPLPRCVIDLEGGGRFYTTMTDCDPDEVRIGLPVELVFRTRGSGGGFPNYGWKCRPTEVSM